MPTLPFLTATLLATTCTLALMHRLAVHYRWNLIGLTVGYAARFVGVVAVVKMIGWSFAFSFRLT